MFVVKSNGEKQSFDETKIQSHAEWACRGLDVSRSELQDSIAVSFYDGISTKEIARGLINAAAQLISEEKPEYSKVAARLTLQTIYKEVTGGGIEYPHLLDYLNKGLQEGRLDSSLMGEWFDHQKLNEAIKPERDMQFEYLGIQTIQDRYLLRERASKAGAGRIFELPQHLFMRVAMALAVDEDDPTERAIEFYDLLSTFDYMSSTPTLFNAGTPHPQLSSCYGNFVPDDLGKIFDLGLKEPGMLSKFAGRHRLLLDSASSRGEPY